MITPNPCDLPGSIGQGGTGIVRNCAPKCKRSPHGLPVICAYGRGPSLALCIGRWACSTRVGWCTLRYNSLAAVQDLHGTIGAVLEQVEVVAHLHRRAAGAAGARQTLSQHQLVVRHDHTHTHAMNKASGRGPVRAAGRLTFSIWSIASSVLMAVTSSTFSLHRTHKRPKRGRREGGRRRRMQARRHALGSRPPAQQSTSSWRSCRPPTRGVASCATRCRARREARRT